MGSFGWANAPMMQRKSLHTSKAHIDAAELGSLHIISVLHREQREHKVFWALLKCVPGLEERLMNADSEEVVQSIAAMVSLHVRESLL